MRSFKSSFLAIWISLLIISSQVEATVPSTDSVNELQPITTFGNGKFSPEPQEPGEANILLIDDDMETTYSAPYLESTHIITALNDGGYSYDIFRSGNWDGESFDFLSGDAGLSIADNYEAIIWYSGWNPLILSDSEESVLQDYLDGNCGSEDSFCVNNRNIIVLTQFVDFVDSNSGSFLNEYMHSDTYYSSYQVMDGTSNPMKGVSDSIFEGTEYMTDTAGDFFMDRPCGIKPYDNSATGAFWMDARKGAADGHEYHAVQFPTDNYVGPQTHKAFMFADEIGVFNDAWDREDFFATILSWMEVNQEQTANIDIGIGMLNIPRHSFYGVIERNVPFEIEVGVTNYGLLTVDSLRVKLKLKNEFGVVLFDQIYDTRAFPEGHPMHISDSIQNGDSVVFTFNKTNDHFRLLYEGKDPNLARSLIFPTSGMNYLDIELVYQGDQIQSNDAVKTRIGSAIAAYTMEPNDVGYSHMTFGDTDDNGASSYDGINWHVVNNYDWDADGCGWSLDAPDNCEENGYSLNRTGSSSVSYSGNHALASFNKNGWYKDNANPSDCDWTTFGDADCPKFTPNPNQDDYALMGPFDLSGMEEVVVLFMVSGCQESGDYTRFQISKDEVSWTNLINYSGFCPEEETWNYFSGSNSKYQGYELGDEWYGSDDTDNVYLRFQADSDNDQNTEGNRPYSNWFIDEVTIRGTEQITRDLAVGDISIREGANMIVKDSQGNSLWREINATVINARNASWTDLPVEFTITNLQGEEMTHYLDETQPTIPNLVGNSKYGDVTQGGGNEDQTDLFSLFRTPRANTYYITVDVLVPYGKDQFPWNNTMTMEFRIFDTFFHDNVESDRDLYDYIEAYRLSTTQNSWKVRSLDNKAYSGQYVWQYAKENGYDANNPTTAEGSDDSLITQDEFDRDGEGSQFLTDVNVDLRGAYKPILTFAIKWDFASGDRLEVRAATDFDSTIPVSSGTWNVLKTFEGDCGCQWSSSDKEQWLIETISLEDFEGYQTWIDFRVLTSNGGGKGVMLDDIRVIGNEYRNNIDIVKVETERYTVSDEEHDISVTVRGMGLEEQYGVIISAQIIDSSGQRVWPMDQTFIHFTIPTALAKGEEFTVDPSVAGADWVWGYGLSPGIYNLKISAWRADEVQVPDENPANNVKSISIVLGAVLLSGDAVNWNLGNGWSAGSYIWDGNNDGSLTSVEFEVWNSQPILVVESEYNLTDAYVKAQVRTGSSGSWYDIKWREVTQLSTLYSIPGANYTQLPDGWTGSSSSDSVTRHTFFADLGSVEQIGDSYGNLQEQYIGGDMQIRLTGTNTGGGGTFTAFYPSVFGLEAYAVDVKSISPSTQNGQPSSESGDTVSRTYTVKVNNFGAASDSGVVDFVLTAPDNSFVVLSDGTMTIMDSILQKDYETYVGVKPVAGTWGNNRDDLSGGDQTAYIGEDGLIQWPSGTTEQFSETGWKIYNPTKSSWDSVSGRPMEPSAANFVSPGDLMTVNIDITIGYAQWAPPGTYEISADARSWSDYDNTFASGDSDGQATLVIAKPDLLIGEVRYTSHATGYSQSGQGWVKNSCGEEEDPYFSFMVEVLNTGTETVGTFRVGLLDFQGNPLGIQTGLYWANNGWAIDESRTFAEVAEIVDVGNKKYVRFKATAAELGMSAGPGESSSVNYDFFISVDTEDTVAESNENNNRVPITIAAVESETTTGGTNGVIGSDISLMSSYMPKSRSSTDENEKPTDVWIASEDESGTWTPSGLWVASENGVGTWTIQIVKMNPQISVNSVHWYLLDVEGKTKSDGLVSEIYGCYSGQSKAVIFIDNDFNGKLSPGDKFEVHPGEAGSDLESVSSVTGYNFHLEYVGGEPNDNEDTISPWDNTRPDGNTSSEDDEGGGEIGILPGFNSLMTIISVGLLAFFRREFNR